jgi:predicted membrane-bound spermidine synthase
MSNHTEVTINWNSSATGTCSGLFWNTSLTQVSATFRNFVNVECSASTIGTGVEVPLLMRPLSTKTASVKVLLSTGATKDCILSVLSNGTLTLQGVADGDVIVRATWNIIYQLL